MAQTAIIRALGGSQGFQGNQGNQGNQGQTGSGTQGNQGNQGFQGNQGNQGQTGNQGTTGSGTQGNQGLQGSQGQDGNQGNQGNQGYKGSGTTGYTVTALTWGVGTSVGNLTSNAFPSNQSFSGFYRLSARMMLNLAVNGDAIFVLISKDRSKAYDVACGYNNPGPLYVQYRYSSGQSSFVTTNNIAYNGWNCLELHVVVLAASKNLVWGVLNGAVYGPYYDTNIDCSTGSFVVYKFEGSGTSGESSLSSATEFVETW